MRTRRLSRFIRLVHRLGSCLPNNAAPSERCGSLGLGQKGSNLTPSGLVNTDDQVCCKRSSRLESRRLRLATDRRDVPPPVAASPQKTTLIPALSSVRRSKRLVPRR